MHNKTTLLAFDFGASSGRLIKATFEQDTLSYQEVHRFENTPIQENGHLCWDFETLLKEVHTGIEKAGDFDSIAFDTWGVDVGLLDKDGNLIQNPFHYRDSITQNAIEELTQIIDAKTLYALTGNQILSFNTLFQLYAIKQRYPHLYEKMDKVLYMSDLFAYHLCNEMVCEISMASTGQFFNPVDKQLCDEVLEKAAIKKSLFCDLVPSGTVIGTYKGAKVIAVAGHDTQCAIAAMPTDSDNAAFVSCGTWSLLGTELAHPILSEISMQNGLSNEFGANGKINYLTNIIGLWLIQESRRQFKRDGKDFSYAELEKLALQAKPFQCFIDPDHPSFVPVGDIPSRIQAFCRNTNQYVPQTEGEIMRCIYESLSLKYKNAVERLSTQTEKQFDVLHILGGGAKDGLLCKMSASSCGIKVIAGPVEATALGNIIIQLVALGKISDIQQGRNLLAKTENVKEFLPTDCAQWAEAYTQFLKILS